MGNYLAVLGIVAVVILFLFFYFKKDKKGFVQYEIAEDQYDMEVLIQFVKDKFNDILKSNLYQMDLSIDEFEKRVKNRAQLRKALKTCSYGDIHAKQYIKNFIRDMLINLYGIKENNINKILDFDNPKGIHVQMKFEILLFWYKKRFHYSGLEKMIEENRLDQEKRVDGTTAYYITEEDIERVYSERVKRLTAFEDKLEVIVQHIYQSYKGYGVVDEIRDMKIDGLSGGVSGIPPTFQEEADMEKHLEKLRRIPFSHDSVWIFYKGKTMHLTFLSFGSEKELIRVCKNIYRYNNPGQLSESNGYKVNEMKDGSRVVVARPPFAESWVFFVRKFDSIKKTRMEELIRDENNELPIGLIRWLIKGTRVTAVTGSQGTGKTTLLMSMIQFINPTFTLRIQEMSFELQLRKIYPLRNIVTFRETSTISGQEGLNLQKKTDGTVNILGEVAEAGVASLMIQMAQVASLFTLFTHHAKTTENLVFSIRNNLLQSGVFHNEKVAEQQVVEVINFDIHLNKSVDGHRYIERITEIIPCQVTDDYPTEYKKEGSFEQKAEAFMDTMREYFVRITDRKTFIARDIVRYDNGCYVPVHPLSEHSQQQIEHFLEQEEIGYFRDFMGSYYKEVAL